MKVYRLIALLFMAIFLTSGCGTDTPTKITQANRVVITAVNDAATEWAAYVNAGKATQKQIDAFHKAYDAYWAAQQTLRAVVEKLAAKDPTTTPADAQIAKDAVQNAELSLLALVNSYLRLT